MVPELAATPEGPAADAPTSAKKKRTADAKRTRAAKPEVAVELDRKIELDLKDQPKRVSYGPPLIARLTRRVADGPWTAFEPAGVFRAELAWLAEAQVD